MPSRFGTFLTSIFLGLAAGAAIAVPIEQELSCPGDFNADGYIDGADLATLLSAWGECTQTYCPQDIDFSGGIDGADLTLLLSSWGQTTDKCIPRPSSERQSKCPVGTTYEGLGYWEYLPHRYEQSDNWPLLVFLHGIGENGDGSAAHLDRIPVHGPARLIAEDNWPVTESEAGDQFVVLSPQNPNINGCHLPGNIDAFLQWAIEYYNVDPQRIYLTGLSCGGIGTWEYLRTSFDDGLLAAAVPICGNGIATWETHQCDLGSLPIWGFHGDADDVISPYGTYLPMSTLQSCSEPEPRDARMTIYPGVGHDSWTQTYNLTAGHDIYAWLLSHRNDDAEP